MYNIRKIYVKTISKSSHAPTEKDDLEKPKKNVTLAMIPQEVVTDVFCCVDARVCVLLDSMII